MSSGVVADREAVATAFDALDAAVDAVVGLDFALLSTHERLVLLERCEKVRRRLPAAEHPLINQLQQLATAEELGGKLSHAVAEWTLTSRTEANRRVRDAADLGARHGLTGEPLAPVLAATATAQRAGKLGAGHVAVIRRFYHQLPGWIDVDTRAHAEAELARLATQYRPDQLAGLADRLADCLNPDGTFTDDDRAHRRGFTLGKQQADGMSALQGWLTPEARATLEAVLAKLAAPGMCNPYDETPCVDGAPSQQAIDHDARSPGPAPTRRIECRPARGPGLGKPRPTQRAARLDHRHHHPGRTRRRRRTRHHRRRHPATDQRRHPPGPPRPPLPGDLRQRQTRRAVSHQTPRLTRTANRVVRQRPRLLRTRLRRRRLLLRSPPHHRLRHLPHHRHRQPHPRPAAPTTDCCNPAAGPPENTPTATPNGSHPHTSTAANPAPTPSTTPTNCCSTQTTTRRPNS